MRLGRELAARVVQPMTRTGLFAHAVPPGLHRGHVDGRGRGARARERRRGARHLRRVGRLRRRTTSPAWAPSRASSGLPLRAHVEQLSTMRSVPVALRVGRALGRPPVGHPPGRRRAARRVRDRRGPAPRRRADERRGHAAGPRARRRRRDLRARHRLQPRHVADRLAAGDRRPRRPALRLERARGAARRDAQRRLRAGPVRASSARSSPASAPTRSCSTARPSTSPTASATTRSPRWSPAASSPGCGPTRPGGCGRDRARPSCATASRGWSRSGWARTARTGSPGRRSWPPPRTGSATQARGAGLRVERDPAGSLWAVPDAPGPWWATGSHLDSVRSGGRYDGALGVAAGFAAAERARAPVAVIAFADEEGARFNTPTFGSRALAGRLDVADALARADDDGVALADAMARRRRRPGRAGRGAVLAAAAARLRRAPHRPDAGPRAPRRARRRRALARLAHAARAHVRRPRRPRRDDPPRRAARRARRRRAADRRGRRAGGRRPRLPRHRRAHARRAERVHDRARRASGCGSTAARPAPAR